MRTPFPRLFTLIASCCFVAACSSPKNGVLEACEQVKRFNECEARLEEILPTSLDCKSLVTKFERICSQQDIDYARQVLKTDADRLCALQSKSEISKYKRSFDPSKVSPVCYQAAQSCGAECLDIEVNEIP